MPEQIQLENRIKLLENIIFDLVKSDRLTFSKDIQFLDGRKIIIATTNGLKIGTGIKQKIAMYGVTPVIQAGAISSPSADVTSLKTAVDAIRTALTNFGITA